MKTSSIILRCRRDDLSTTHIRLAVTGKDVVVTFGTVQWFSVDKRPLMRFMPSIYSLEMSAKGELFDGVGWDSIELNHIVSHCRNALGVRREQYQALLQRIEELTANGAMSFLETEVLQSIQSQLTLLKARTS